MMNPSAIASAIVSALGLAMISTAISAAEINFVSSTAMREPLEELVPAFEKASGHKVVVAFYPAATLVIKVKEGIPADLVMTTPDNIETLTKDGKLVTIDFDPKFQPTELKPEPAKVADIGLGSQAVVQYTKQGEKNVATSVEYRPAKGE